MLKWREIIIDIYELNQPAEFFQLRQQWNKILQKSEENNLFLTWEKIAPTVMHLPEHKTLKILLAKEGNNIIGIAPLRKSKHRIVGNHLGYDTIEPIAFGHSDYTGVILPERKAECIQAFLAYLFKLKDWEIMYLNDIPESSSFIKILIKNRKQFPKFTAERGFICPYLPIPTSEEELLSNLSPKFRTTLKRTMRRLLRDHMKVNMIEYHEAMSIDQAMHTFFKLHQQRWIRKGKSGAFKEKAFRKLYVDLAKLMAEKDWLRLYFLIVDNKPVATLFAYEYNKKMYGQLTGFDPKYSVYGVGNILILNVLKECIKKGIEEFDFLQGDDSYKFKWTKKYRNTINITFINKKQSSKLINFALKMANKMPYTEKILNQLIAIKKQ